MDIGKVPKNLNIFSSGFKDLSQTSDLNGQAQSIQPLSEQVTNCGREGKELATFIENKCPDLKFRYKPEARECVVLNPSSSLSVSDLQGKLVGSDLSGYEPFVKRTEQGLLVIVLKVKITESGKHTLAIEKWGCLSESMLIPSQIPCGTKVLDVGSGNGIMARRMRDELKCDVYAIEPGVEASNAGLKDPFEESKIQIGSDRVEKLTVQEAANDKKYISVFDVVTVYKWNIPLAHKHDALKSLPLLIKPSGLVIIHSVEKERCFLGNKHDAHLYLVDTLQTLFDSVQIMTRNYQDGSDGIIVCSKPKLSM